MENLISKMMKLRYESDSSIESELHLYKLLFQELVEHAPVGVYILENGVLSYVNASFCSQLGYRKEEITAGLVPLDRFIHPDDLPLLKEKTKLHGTGGTAAARCCVRGYEKDGSLIYAEIHSSFADVYGKEIRFGSVIDITEQVRTEMELKESHEQYKSLFTNSPDAVFSFDDIGTFLNANPATETITGYSIDEIVGSSFLPLILPEDMPLAVHHFEEAKRGVPSSGELSIIRKDGKRVYLEATHFPMKVNGEIVGTYGIARDITQRVLYDQQMERYAFYDSLTELPNRKCFEDRLERVIRQSGEVGKPFSVLFLDLDRFKIINDSLGHHLGDEFLKLVSKRLLLHLRKTDTLSRFAGDEFTLLFPDTTQEETIRAVERICSVLKEPFTVGGHTISISASIGIAYGVPQDTVQDLIRNADRAMYETKKFKKSSYTVYSEELDQRATYKLTLERDLRSAIRNNELELHYQPIIQLKTNKIVSMEALVRWNHPRLGSISPGDFIPIAEESGQIFDIGSWVLRAACRQNRLWQEAGIPPFKMAVNISTKQLQSRQFVSSVTGILESEKLEPAWLELEVTESVLLDDEVLVKESLAVLKRLGICISIDDFGTGYTSLSYLRQYPFDKVKIDSMFIDDISRDRNGKQIASAIISLAHSLQMDVVAEGIENDIQLSYLAEEGCDEVQGYLFSRPLPAQELARRWWPDAES